MIEAFSCVDMCVMILEIVRNINYHENRQERILCVTASSFSSSFSSAADEWIDRHVIC
jgi:hypothetical protein